MRTILPQRIALIYQPQIRLVYEGSGLQSVALALPPKMAGRKTAKLFVNEGSEVFERSLISIGP
jgi:hypothetical protein